MCDALVYYEVSLLQKKKHVIFVWSDHGRRQTPSLTQPFLSNLENVFGDSEHSDRASRRSNTNICERLFDHVASLTRQQCLSKQTLPGRAPCTSAGQIKDSRLQWQEAGLIFPSWDFITFFCGGGVGGSNLPIRLVSSLTDCFFFFFLWFYLWFLCLQWS